MGRYGANLSPFEDHAEYSEDTQPSWPASSKSSVSQTPLDTPPGTAQETKPPREFFEPPTPPEKHITVPDGSLAPPGFPRGTSRRSNDSGASFQTAPDDEIAPIPPTSQLPPSHQVETAQAQENTVKPATEKQTTTEAEIKSGKRKITFQKYLATGSLIGINTLFIFASWWWARYYYVYLPFIAFPLVLNCIMIVSLICFKLRNIIRPERIIESDHTEDLVMIMPCYNETMEECTKSLDSLVDQVGIEHHKRGILVVCDGRVRGPGMEKTTADYLLEDIFVEHTHREKIKNAYRAWDGTTMDLEMSRGLYKGVPYYCIVKERNQGKRDSLIVVRSFLYKFNIRRSKPETVFSPYLFHSMTTWLTRDVGVDQVDHLIGMDADTVFEKDCIAELLKESKYPNTVGVCGFVAVDFSGGSWNPWRLYQNAEYSIAQGLRRLHQSMATKKVSCLPGCCQLLKVCDFTCGDKVLVELFGYHPRPKDGMIKQIRATASEDRNHVCLMLTTHPKAETRQALRARAFTDVPHSWSVFLSQRRRWSLGATSNDLLLFTSWHCQWFERILALCNVMVWCLSVFIVAAIGCMIVAFISQPWWIILAFASIMIVPLVYYLVMATWLPRTMRERMQYLAGLSMFVIIGPFLNLIVLVFSVWNMDSFGWGKTRMVVPDDSSSSNSSGALEKTAAVGPWEIGANGRQTLAEGRGNDEEANVGMRGSPPLAAAAPVARRGPGR